MTAYTKTLRARETFSASWYVTPILMAALVVSIFFVDVRGESELFDDAVATLPATDDTPHHALLLTPSPQPGEGEHELVPADLPASY